MTDDAESVLIARRFACTFLPRIGRPPNAPHLAPANQYKPRRLRPIAFQSRRASFGHSFRAHGRLMLNAHDRLLASNQEPPLGAHVVTLRRGFTHHGIYVGRGTVVQYGGLARGLRRAPVEEVPMMEFAQGHPIWVRSEGGIRQNTVIPEKTPAEPVGDDASAGTMLRHANSGGAPHVIPVEVSCLATLGQQWRTAVHSSC